MVELQRQPLRVVTTLLLCHDAVEFSRSFPGTLIAVEDHPMQSAAVQGKGLLHRKLGGV